MSRINAGDVLGGFTLTERLRSGGMGALWRATKAGIDVPLLLKVPFFDPGQDVSTVVGYEVEEMILKRLSGPHVPRFFGSGDLAEVPFIAMEFVQGETLADIVEKAPVSHHEVVRIGTLIANALGSLHRQNVAHLDLKPANIILAPRGAVLIDFGLARHFELPDLFGEESDVPMGTPAYISPEQVLGNRNSLASDIFALGCILYELATGTTPFGEPTTASGMKRRLFQTPPSAREVNGAIPRWLSAVISRCMEVDPLRRYPLAGNVAFDLTHPDQVVIPTDNKPAAGWAGRLRSLLRRGKPAADTTQIASVVSRSSGRGAVVLVAVDLSEGADALAEEVRAEAVRVLRAYPGARLACLTVLKTELLGSGGDEVDAAGRTAYVNRLVALKDWAAPLRLGDESVSFHVVEAVGPAAAILQFAKHNDVGHIVLGARASSALRRHLGSVSAEVVAEALCSVSVVRVKRIEERATEAA
jgi:nucleotide-binding universal stress UspA family protein